MHLRRIEGSQHSSNTDKNTQTFRIESHKNIQWASSRTPDQRPRMASGRKNFTLLTDESKTRRRMGESSHKYC